MPNTICCWKNSKISKTLVRLIKREKEKTQIISMKTKRRDITVEPPDIKLY